MDHLRVLPRCVIAAACLALGGTAFAANTSFDFERLWLDPSARGSLVIGSGETLPAGGLRLSVSGGWERSPLVLTDKGMRGRGLFANDDRVGDVVRNRWTLHLTAAVGITSRLEIGGRLPMTVSQNGSDLTADGFPPLRKTLVGTPSVMGRFGLTQQGGGMPVSTAIAFEAAFPVDKNEDLNGNPRPYYLPRLEIGHRTNAFLVAADLGASLRPRSVPFPTDDKLHNEMTAGAVFATVGRPLRYEVSARGAFNAASAPAAPATLMN